ncbi:MAG: zinc ribbon domain-containing protein [Candidatus Methanoperedens sp.]|nr:zinc ribbon domain-containing protein [Candidatus Methanoperedens sp.]
MKKELQKPVINAILALILIILVRIVAMVILKPVDTIYSVIDIALSLAVIVVLLRLMSEFNRQLAISSPGYPQARHAVKWFILLLVILTLYGAFRQFAADLPYGIYYIIFFILALIPVYSLWNVLYKNAALVLELIKNISLEDNLMCSCGWNNPISAKFCNRCGSPVGKV